MTNTNLLVFLRHGVYSTTGWPKKVSHYQFSKNLIKDCQRDYISS